MDDYDSFLGPSSVFGSLLSGVASFGRIEFSQDEDWFAVSLVAGNDYRIEVRPDTGNPSGELTDPLFVGVYDDMGILQPGSGDDNSGPGFSAEAIYTASYTGTHYFGVEAANGFDQGFYQIEYVELAQTEVVNEGDDLTLSIPTELPIGILPPFPLSGSPDELIADRQISVIITSADAIESEDFTVTYTFGQTQSLNFAALLDELVEDDEGVTVQILGTVDWIVPNPSSNFIFTNLLGGTVQGDLVETQIDFTRSFAINSAPYGVPDPIEDYSFTEPEIIGNVLTNFADGSDELFTVIPFTFDSPTATGELLENGDLLINEATGTEGQSLVIRFTAIDARGARTESEQIVEFGTLDDYLPGDDALVFGSIDLGLPELGSIEQLDDRDRFVVSLEVGQLYSISLNSASDGVRTLADPEIFGVYDSLNVLVENSTDNDNGPGLNALVDGFVVETSGEYEIEVGSHTPFGLGGYELSIISLGAADDFLPGAFADEFGAATVDVPAFGEIESLGDRDRFDISLLAGAEYNISLEGSPTGGGSNPNTEIIGVFTDTGAFVAGSADNNSGTDTNALISGLTVPGDGLYQIEVAGARDLNIGDYTLTVEFAGFIDDFLPGIADGVGSVSVGGRATGEIETVGDVDAFRVGLQSNTTYQINILGRDSNNGTLLDPDLLGIFSSSDLSGNPISAVQTINEQLIRDDSISYYSPQSSGDFFIGVQDAFDGLGTYTVEVINLGLRDDYSADIDTTGSITPGGSASGRIDFTQDNDWFEANLTANRLYEISLVPTGDGALADPFFNGVYDSNGMLIQNTTNDDGGSGTSSSLQFVADTSGVYYLSAGGFGDATGQYRLELNDLGPLDDGRFDITIEFTSDDIPDEYIQAFEDAVERWEDIIVGDLDYDFVDGYGYVDDILIEVAVQDIELTFEGVEQTILGVSSVLDQRDGLSGTGALPTYSRIVINSEEVGQLLNLDEFVANTIGRALGFGALWEEFGIVRLIDGVPTYTGANGLREMEELSDDLNGQNALEDGANGGLAAEYWSEAVFDEELMTSSVETRRPDAGPGNIAVPDNPISELTIAAMQDLGYEVDYDEADFFRLDPGALARQASVATTDTGFALPPLPVQSSASQRLLTDLADNANIPNGAAYIYTRPNVLSEAPSTFALNAANTELVIANGTNAVFIEGVTGESLKIELTGTFAKNNPTELPQLSGTVTSMEVRSLDGQLLFSVDYTQEPTSVAQVAAQWPNYPIDGDNIVIIDTLPGTVARVNPNGGTETDSRIFTGAGDDFVRGGDLDELINGGADNDTLEGGRGNDEINGGGGIDTAAFSGAQSSYTLTLSPGSTIIQDRRGDGNGQDTLFNIERLDFDTDFFPDAGFDLQQFGGPTGLSEADFESFIELYIAYFNRAPDAIGLNFWGTVFANGFTLEAIASEFVGQPETRETYPEGTTTLEFTTAVYNNVLGRTPDQSGLDFWTNALDSGQVTRDFFILDVLRGAKSDLKPEQGQDFVDQQIADRAYLSDKTDIGAYFAVHKGMSDVTNASVAMAQFDGTEASITAAVSTIDGFHNAALNPTSGEFLMPLVGVLDDPFAAA
jgi:hypothetical protein